MPWPYPLGVPIGPGTQRLIRLSDLLGAKLLQTREVY